MVRTVRPNARLTPKKPMPRAGKPAASTALPQPAKVNQNVPKNSAPRRRGISIESPPSAFFDTARIALEDTEPAKDLAGPDRRISQEVTERFYNLLAAGGISRCAIGSTSAI